jgi:hypothetical protein
LDAVLNNIKSILLSNEIWLKVQTIATFWTI